VTEPCLPAKLQDVRVLIVDDNAANQEILTIRLGLWGMRPLPVSNGPDALLALSLASDQNDPFRIALIDMQMPGMDGATLGQTIKADNRIAKTHLVMLTSLGVRGTARTFEELGFAGYATKPIRPLELRAILSLVLAGGNSVGSQTNPIATRHTVHEKWNLFVGRKARVLIAEDNITNQKVALGILKRLGLHADAVANGEEALKALETLPYDVVLMDIQMPLMDGLEATRRIRQPNSPVLNPEIPIIAMTAHAMQGDRERCLNAGMNDFLSKPISPLPLLETLEKWFPAFSQTPSTTDSLTPSVPHLPEEHEPVPEENRPVFDKREMMARLGFKEELVHDILETFLQSAAANLEKLKGFIAADDLRNAGLIAHSMSGAAANISCWGIRAVARKMENAAREGDIADVKNCLPELERLFSLLQKELQQNHE
jgi:CheY-like chemotaxis protein/HPt (histidine-containing phosphotransfer) domain-containing protein